MVTKKQKWSSRIIGHDTVDPKSINKNKHNWRVHPVSQQNGLKNVLNEVGYVQSIIVNKRTGNLVDGHLRVEMALNEGIKKIPVSYIDVSEKEEKLILATIDPLAAMAEFDNAMLKEIVSSINDEYGDVLDSIDLPVIDSVMGDLKDRYDDDIINNGHLRNKYGVPPFTVLDARKHDWQERKIHWRKRGVLSHKGRDDDLLDAIGTSVFDPVLCELIYLWFSSHGDIVIDPFAGGSVRGLIAGYMGRKYIGLDIRQEQIDANKKQASSINNIIENPTWITGDSRHIQQYVNVTANLLISCPPYAYLEKYSDLPGDISNLEYDEFVVAYSDIIKATYNIMNDNSFAIFVVGEIRDKRGHYYNFVSDTISAFIDAGYSYYNEAILITPIGTLPLRVQQPFNGSRKLGKTHQNILCFVKGSPKKAASRLGDIDFSNLNLDDDNG